MNNIRKKILLTAITALLATAAQSSVAAASAQANIDWSNLNIQYFPIVDGNAPILNWTYSLGTVDSTAYTSPSENQDDFDSVEDLTSSLSTNTVTTRAQSSTQRDGSILKANAATQPSSGLFVDINEAYASAHNYLEFEVTGYGVALITVPWSTEGVGSDGDWDDYAFAATYFTGEFSDGNGNAGTAISSHAYYTSENGPFNFNGTFSMAIFSDGLHAVIGTLSAEAVANAYSPVAAVPVPTSVWLFGTGLFGMLGVSRRRQKLA